MSKWTTRWGVETRPVFFWRGCVWVCSWKIPEKIQHFFFSDIHQFHVFSFRSQWCWAIRRWGPRLKWKPCQIESNNCLIWLRLSRELFEYSVIGGVFFSLLPGQRIQFDKHIFSNGLVQPPSSGHRNLQKKQGATPTQHSIVGEDSQWIDDRSTYPPLR